MNYKIEFTKDVEKAIKKWKRSNKPLFDKLKKVLFAGVAINDHFLPKACFSTLRGERAQARSIDGH